jgi:hypothetical protein
MIYKKPTFEFASVFAPYIREHIELRESLGIKMRVQSGVLRQFDRYCIEIGVKQTGSHYINRIVLRRGVTGFPRLNYFQII